MEELQVLDGRDKTFEQWVTMAHRVWGVMQMAKPKFKPKKRDGKTETKKEDNRVPKETINTRRKEGHCLKCREKGHLANKCTKGWNKEEPKEEKGKKGEAHIKEEASELGKD